MSFKKRFIFHTMVLLFVVVFLLLLLIGAAIFFAWMKTGEIEREKDFASTGLPSLIDAISIENGNLVFDQKLLDKVEEYGGWIQLIDEQGKVIYSYRTPPDVPKKYNPGELTAYWTGQKPFPYAFYVWIEMKENHLITLLYGFKDIAYEVLDHLKRMDTNGDTELPVSLISVMKEGGIWAQLLDDQGVEIASWNKPIGEPDFYSPQDLILRTQYSERYSSRILTSYDEESKRTWIVHTPHGSPASPTMDTITIHQVVAVFLVSFLVFVIVVILLMFSFALWYGHRFGTPILHMMDWLQHLSRGNYCEPSDRKGRPRSQNSNGKLKRRYRLFSDMIDSFRNLTESLRKNEEIRGKLEQAKEEWIAGVTHDLKTPLSSILGYAHILGTEAYDWSQTEIRQFANVIKEKSEYMNELIEDLNMTYRLKNNALVLKREVIEMNSFIEKSIKQFLDDPQFTNTQIDFSGTNQPVLYEIDQKWFRRIMDNLLANAIMHNPDGTPIHVSLSVNGDCFSVRFKDEGVGMTPETVERLFDRYFRGTNTERNGKGSGLGMAISKQLVLLHGGSIDVESEVGKGTTIALHFKKYLEIL